MSLSVVRFGLETLERQTETFIKEIKTLDDEKLIERYRQTLQLGDVVWRMECAIAAEMLDRAIRKKGGRGNADGAEEGRTAAAKKLATQLDIAPRTVLVAAQIHREFFETTAPACASLASNGLTKKFYQLAVETENPLATIQRFADAKASDPDFSIRAAKRLLATEDAPALDHAIWDGMENEEKRTAWAEYQRAYRYMKTQFPWLGLTLTEHIADVRERLTQPTTTVRLAILAQVADGLSTVEEISGALGKPRDFVTIWLGKLVESGDLIATPAGRKEGARGAVKTLYSLGKNKA